METKKHNQHGSAISKPYWSTPSYNTHCDEYLHVPFSAWFSGNFQIISPSHFTILPQQFSELTSIQICREGIYICLPGTACPISWRLTGYQSSGEWINSCKFGGQKVLLVNGLGNFWTHWICSTAAFPSQY